jgi:hypothetical protein
MTVAELIEILKVLPQDLRVFVTNGDLPDAPATSAEVVAADYGQEVLVSR